jgi:hypothetical protein
MSNTYPHKSNGMSARSMQPQRAIEYYTMHPAAIPKEDVLQTIVR